MNLRKVVLDTSLYIGWLNESRFQDLMIGPGIVRYLSAVVQMELRVGAKTLPARQHVDRLAMAYQSSSRLIVPAASTYDEAGHVLQRLRGFGREIRRASLVHDVLIALSARSIGATVVTADEDFEQLRKILDFDLVRVSA
jgi:predicted nucleic acid-binding protein